MNDRAYRSSRRYYRGHFRLVALAVAVTVAVIVGSLLVGHSVRQTLVSRVSERLGTTETVVFSRGSFLADSLLRAPLFAEGARGVLLTDGFIPRDGKLIPVMVWGMEDDGLRGQALLNQPLADELRLSAAEDIVLRLPKGGLVPSGSLFVTDNYTASLRLGQAGIKAVADGGNLSLKNEQALPLNIFVSRAELAEAMEVEGRLNLILCDRLLTEEELAAVWTPAYSGLRVDREESYTEVTSDRVFLQGAVVDRIAEQNQSVNPLFTYLANGIRLGDGSIPYSFVTALDEFDGYRLQPDELLLSDYAAQRLGARVGDVVSVSYYVSKGLKDLKTDSVSLRVGRIVPLQELVADGRLSAEFPGLSDVERCTDWDSDLPLDMTLITAEDEDYWDRYRSTPKALLPYAAVREAWSNDYGTATALRIYDEAPRVGGLRLSMFDIQIVHPRESGLSAARNGIDFASLFLALGFFIILSALLLFVSPLGEMYWQRRGEVSLLKAVGYSEGRIVRLLWREALPVVLAAAVVGVGAGILYTVVVMWLLGNIWNGATQTTSLGVYIGAVPVAVGVAVSLLLVLLLLYRCIAKAVHTDSAPGRKALTSGRSVKKPAAVVLTLVAVGLFIVNVFIVNSLYLFVVLGMLAVAVAGLWGELYVQAKSESPAGTRSHLIYATLCAGLRQHRVSYYALAFGVFTVFAVGLNRQQVSDTAQAGNASGGYQLWAESTVPVYYDLNTPEGRHQLALESLPDDAEFLQTLRLGADDASCLNLNKVSQPTILGVDMQALSRSDFQVAGGADFTRFSERMGEAIPVLIDQESLMWSLGKSVGDTLYYTDARGETVALLIAGALRTGVFQGYALMDGGLFRELWPQIAGTEVMLVRTAQPMQAAQVLSQALNEYGIRVMTTADRLNQFNQLVNTYLSIFLSLGGIGMLLGILSFVIVIRKSLLVRQADVRLYQSIGYSPRRIQSLLFSENIRLPIYAIFSGTVAALLSVCNNFGNNDWLTWLQALCFMLQFVGLTWYYVRRVCRRANVQSLMVNVQSSMVNRQ